MLPRRDRGQTKLKKRKANYDIGYGKPPKEHQFKPGQSGNPKGRPKKPKTIKEALQKAIAAELVSRNGEGEVIKINCAEALAKKTIADAISKDGPTRRMFFKNEFLSLEAEDYRPEDLIEEEISEVEKNYGNLLRTFAMMSPETREARKNLILKMLDDRYFHPEQ